MYDNYKKSPNATEVLKWVIIETNKDAIRSLW